MSTLVEGADNTWANVVSWLWGPSSSSSIPGFKLGEERLRRGRHGNVKECLKRYLANSSVVSWPVPGDRAVVVTHPGLRGHGAAVDLGPGAVEDGGGELRVLRGGESGHGVRASGGALGVIIMVPDVSC